MGRDIGLISLVLTLQFVRHGMVFPLVPLIAQNLGASPSVIGLVVAAFSFFPFFLSVPLGGVADAWGVRRMVALGVACNIANGLILLHARSLTALVLAQIVGGLGFQLHVVPTQVFVSRLRDAKARESGFGLLAFGSALGQTLGPALGGWMAGRLGYSVTFLAASVVSAAGLVVLRLREGERAASPVRHSLRRDIGQARVLLADRRMRAVLAFSFAVILAVGLRASFFPVLMRNQGVGETTVGLLLAVLAGTSTLVRPFVGFFLSGFSRRALLGLAACTVVAGTTGTPFLSSPLLLALLLGVFGIGFGLTQPLSMVMVADLVRPEQSGIAMGLRFTALTGADLVGPVLLGFVVEGVGPTSAFLLTGAIVAAVAIQILVVNPRLVPGRREE